MKRSPIRVLVVDDDAGIRHLLRVNLELEGYEVCEAADGVEALERVAAYAPDVVTLDVSMPRLGGIPVLSELRADPATAHLLVVLLSGRAEQAAGTEDGEWDAGRRAAADAYLAKPFDPEELVALVTSLVEGR